MHTIILAILQKVGTEALLMLLHEIIDMIKGREDNDLNEEHSEVIKAVTDQVNVKK